MDGLYWLQALVNNWEVF